MQTDYIDLLLVHWPDDRPVPQVLKDFELLKKAGITRHIGVSNFSIRQMREALASGIVVYNHQFHIYPGSVNRELITYCQDNHVSVTAYSPLDEGRVVNDRKLSEAARQQGITPARAALKQLLALGLIVIPKASKREHLEENFAALSGGDRDGQS
ncbi:hypothetical protein A2Z33_06050 [Candidatus Gottesmanbacteria bacterium RBG_16_52_11]|uniref:NADP-dependent oxidoreductase domain-containing protein n=1 Tax=Candidatus Gottesmanbacteria bacterium RBG_16_52_11 TaxID=1798374 RepID=A0A1F5YXA9_9BACT|nr:MAG: hypothetical protein A2Z33_06050 [Candidatus Gottesmanbacteria bacterium RBG_16_52_11]